MKRYKNGIEFKNSHITEAREILNSLGLNNGLGNFGPLLKQYSEVNEREGAISEFTKGDYLFMEFKYVTNTGVGKKINFMKIS